MAHRLVIFWNFDVSAKFFYHDALLHYAGFYELLHKSYILSKSTSFEGRNCCFFLDKLVFPNITYCYTYIPLHDGSTKV